MKTFVIDIDGTICTNTFGQYEKAEPFYDRINHVNKLYDEGNIIKFFTARGSSTKINWKELTEKQLSQWKVNYHELIMGKPEGDIFIDDKSFNSESWPWEGNVNKKNKVLKYMNKNIETYQKIIGDYEIRNKILEIAESIHSTFVNNGKLFLAGNGGSFSDSQHIAAEYIARFRTNRFPLPAIALGTNSSNLTAIGNDFGFENIFSRELEALSCNKDFLIALTTSGNSQNMINLLKKSKEIGINSFVLTGKNGGDLAKICDNCLIVPSDDTAVIQQCHITILHTVVDISEEKFL